MAESVRNVQTQQFGQVEQARNARLGKTAPIRNATVQRVANDPAPITAPRSDYPDTATQFRQQYAQAGLQPQAANVTTAPTTPQSPVVTASATVDYYMPAQSVPMGPVAPDKGLLQQRAERQLGRAVATTVNSWVLATVSFLSVIILIFALLSITFLTMAFALEFYMGQAETTVAAGEEAPATSWFRTVFINLTGYVASGAVTLAELITGVDLDILHPMNGFVITYGVTVFFSWMVLLLMYLIYILTRLKPLSGKGEGIKKGMFLLAIVGSVIPVANALPWYLLWGAVVWVWPK